MLPPPASADLTGGTCTAQTGTIWYDSCLPQIPGAQHSDSGRDRTRYDHGRWRPAPWTSSAPICPPPWVPCATYRRPDDSGLLQTTSPITSRWTRARINIGISVEKGNTALKDAMNDVLSTMTADDFNADHARGHRRPARDLKFRKSTPWQQPALASSEPHDATLSERSPLWIIWSSWAATSSSCGRNYWFPNICPASATRWFWPWWPPLIGCLIGLLCGILNTIPHTKKDHPVKRFFLELIRVMVRIYVEVFRGTPMVLQAVFLYYGLPYFTDNAVPFTSICGIGCASLVVSINTGAYMAESVRGGIISIDPGQTEGAKAIGMTHVQTMTSVILPQAIRNIMPQIGNNFIINVKDTSVMFIIGFTEFFAAHRSIVGVNLHVLPLRRHRDGRLSLHDADWPPSCCGWWRSRWTAQTAMSWYRPTP